MGRKLSQTSVTIAKKEKKEFNSLIRFLRPKVYITDCSRFKTLVQDLTGNGSSSISTITSSLHPQQQLIVPVVDVEEYQVVEPESSTSVDVSASFDSSFELCNQDMYMNDQETNQPCYQMYSDDTTATNIVEGSSSPSTADLMLDMLPFQDLESLFSGTEPFDPFSYNCYGWIDPEVSIFDYELSGLLS